MRPSLAGREQLFEAVYQLLARWAEDRPLLLIVEDVHWLDRSSRDLLAFLVRAARRDRIVVLVTYRPDELHQGHPMLAFLTELERSGRARIYYGASTLVCTPASRSQEVGLALGARAGEARLRDVVTSGGFSRFRRAAETPFNLVLEARP